MRQDVFRFCRQIGKSIEEATRYASLAEIMGVGFVKARAPAPGTCDECGEIHLLPPTAEQVKYFARTRVDLTEREKELLQN